MSETTAALPFPRPVDTTTRRSPVDERGNSDLHNLLLEALRTPDPIATLATPTMRARRLQAMAQGIPDAPNKDGQHVEHLAAQTGSVLLIESMALAGADFAGRRDKDARTPLFYTCYARDCVRGAEAARAVIRLGGDPDARSARGVTPTLQACATSPEIIEAMTEGGGDTSARDIVGNGAGYYAVLSRKPELVETVGAIARARGEDLMNVQNREGVTAGHLIAYTGDVAMIEAGSRAGVDYNIKDSGGQVAAHRLVSSPTASPRAVEALAAADGRFDIADADGKPPIAYEWLRGARAESLADAVARVAPQTRHLQKPTLSPTETTRDEGVPLPPGIRPPGIDDKRREERASGLLDRIKAKLGMDRIARPRQNGRGEPEI